MPKKYAVDVAVAEAELYLNRLVEEVQTLMVQNVCRHVCLGVEVFVDPHMWAGTQEVSEALHEGHIDQSRTVNVVLLVVSEADVLADTDPGGR